MKDIIDTLNQASFSIHRWSPLGLQLGLLQPTLSSIRTKYRDDPENCLQECLTLWLSKADRVTESGGPTLDSLTGALSKLGENACADKIKEFSEEIQSLDILLLLNKLVFIIDVLSTPASRVLQKHSDRLSPLTLSVKIVQMLYTERVISKETLDEMNELGGVLGDGPLRALHSTVSKEPDKLKMFASILLKSEQTVPIAQDIMKEYGK